MGRILVIEDEPGTQLLLQSRLHDLGHEVVTAPTGAMGVMEARGGGFDLFLVDVMLGSGIDGYEVCRRLKAMPHCHGVPVVLVSGVVKNRDELHRGYEAGCESFLIKGDITLLEDVVRAMLRIKSLQDDLGMQNRLLDEHNRRLQEERARGAELEDALRGGGSNPEMLKELVSSKAEALLVVDGDGVVALVDRGAREMFGKELEGRQLGALAVGTGLEAYVRDARTEPREGFRFDLAGGNGRETRKLTASILPLMVRAGHADRGYKVVLLSDSTKRQVAADVLRVQEKGAPRRELGPLIEAARFAFHPSSLLGISPPMSELRRTVMDTAGTDVPCLIVGEEGTGKQRVARALHFGSARSGHFVPVQCGALSPEELEVELFGAIKGATPEVVADRPGLFHHAEGGTLFLDDLGRMPLSLQKRLIQFIETGEIQRVGSKKPEKVGVRMVCSLGQDFDRAADDGRVQPELHNILSRHLLRVPSLRDRLMDVPMLAQHFLARFGATLGQPEFSDEAMWVLENYDWPGNVRELKSYIERACGAATDPIIEVDHLPQPLRDLHLRLKDQNLIAPARRLEERIGGTHVATPMRYGGGGPVVGGPVDGIEDDEVSLEAYEKKALLRALDITEGDKLAAARKLGIGKSTLYRKLKRYDIR